MYIRDIRENARLFQVITSSRAADSLIADEGRKEGRNEPWIFEEN